MRPLKYWATHIASDVVIFSLLAYQIDTGSEGALTAFKVWTWTISVLMLIGALFVDNAIIAKNPRPTGFFAYHVATEILLITAVAWIGMPALASVRLIAVLFMESARKSAEGVAP